MNEIEEVKQKALSDLFALTDIEFDLENARRTAVKSAIRLRDLQYCQSVGLIADADYEINAMSEVAQSTARQYIEVRDYWQKAKTQAAASGQAYTKLTNDEVSIIRDLAP